MSRVRHFVHAGIAAVSILAIGVVLGVVLDRTVLLSSGSEAHGATAAVGLDERHRTFHRELAEELGLSDTQAEQVREILIRHQAAVDQAWVAVHTQLESVIDSVTAEIEAILDPRQRDRLFEYLREQHGMPARSPEDESL